MLTGREGKSHYYQSAEDEDQREEEEDQSSLPIYSDYGVESDANRERGYCKSLKVLYTRTFVTVC